MSLPMSPTRLFVCTACGATLPIGEEHVGKKCRCGRCGRVSLISADTATTTPATTIPAPAIPATTIPAPAISNGGPAGKPTGAALAQRISFGCRVCDTRLAARVKDVGRKAKCPDCGALTVVPPQQQPSPRQVPAAMHGQQYGLCAAAAICLAVLTESSEGNDRLHNPPGPVFLDWMGDVFYLVTAGMLALAPWWLLCRVLEQELPIEAQAFVMVAGWLFTFPLLLLSCLENGSPMELFSARIFGSVSKRPGLWLLFVVESVVIVGGTCLAAAGCFSFSPAMALLAIPLGVAAALLYFRVLGRFAWWLAESLAATED